MEMEKSTARRPNNNNIKGMKQQIRSLAAAVWDCESSLYDSFELRSFEKQLSSAIISSRTLSMPHLSSDRVRVAPAPPSNNNNNDPALTKKPNTMSSKISKSVQRFFKSVFIVRSTHHHHHQHQRRHNKHSSDDNRGAYLRPKEERPADREYRYVVYDKSGALTTIPEGPETDFGFSPDINSLVRKSVSERFTLAPPPLAVGATRAY